jgi:hypothetical protein
MNDTLKPVRDLLLKSAVVTDIVGQRIYAHRDNPPIGYTLDAGPCICMKVRGGAPDLTGNILEPSIQFKCISTSEVDANTVYRALYMALDGVQDAVVRYASCEVLGQTIYDPETKWNMVLTYFKARIDKG